MKLPERFRKLQRNLQVWGRMTKKRTHYKLNKRFVRFIDRYRDEVMAMSLGDLESLYIQHFYGKGGEYIK